VAVVVAEVKVQYFTVEVLAVTVVQVDLESLL
jgi:hypothetical protein